MPKKAINSGAIKLYLDVTFQFQSSFGLACFTAPGTGNCGEGESRIEVLFDGMISKIVAESELGDDVNIYLDIGNQPNHKHVATLDEECRATPVAKNYSYNYTGIIYIVISSGHTDCIEFNPKKLAFEHYEIQFTPVVHDISTDEYVTGIYPERSTIKVNELKFVWCQ